MALLFAAGLLFAPVEAFQIDSAGAGGRTTAAPITLYGNATMGWGLTPSTMANPGPTLTAAVGEQVELILNSTDGAAHAWFLDDNDNGIVDAGESASPTFTSEVVYFFTPTHTGTSTYRCKFHPDAMRGTIVIEVIGARPLIVIPPLPASAFLLGALLAGGGAGIAAGVYLAIDRLIVERRPGDGPANP